MSMSSSSASNGQRPPAVYAADAAFERLMSEVEDVSPAATELPQTSQRLADALTDLTRSTGGEPLRAAVARSLDVFSDLVVGMTGVFADVVDTTLRSADGGGGAQPDQPVVLSGPPGGHARATIWIHISGGAAVQVASLRLTDLTAHDGTVLAGSSAAFGTGTATTNPERASARLEITIPAALGSGIYYGHVLATGVPGAALPVHLEVAP